MLKKLFVRELTASAAKIERMNCMKKKKNTALEQESK